MKALNGFGFPALRFNFRGAGLSHGEHDNGRGEVDDVRTALDWLDREFRLPTVFAGFSFGAAVGLQTVCHDDRVVAAIGLGLPVQPVDGRTYDLSYLTSYQKPKLFVSGSRDQFGPRGRLQPFFESLPEPKKLVMIESADHFFEGRLREMRDAIETWVRETGLG
jgi:alpha/beta superfamily hydrolase